MIAVHLTLYVFYLTLFLFIIIKEKPLLVLSPTIPLRERKQFAFFFLLKVAAGVLLTLIYTYYYTDSSKSDIYRYFNDSKVISSLLFTHPKVWLCAITGIGLNNPENFQYMINTQYFSHPVADVATDNAFIIRFISILNFFSFSNIYINTLLLNFISFIALVIIYKRLSILFPEFRQIILVPLFLVPSVVFWSSGLLKEQFVFIAFGIIACAFNLAGRTRIAMSALGFLIGFYVKAYIFLILLTAFGVYYLFIIQKRLLQYVLILLVLVTGVFVLKNSKACDSLIEKRNEFITLAHAEMAGSLIEAESYNEGCPGLIKHAPQFLVNAVLRPFVWERGNLFQLIFAIENLVLVAILIYCLIGYFACSQKRKLILFFPTFIFCLLNYFIIGVTVPVIGAIVHYRIICTPFLIISVLCLINLEKIKSELNGRFGLNF